MKLGCFPLVGNLTVPADMSDGLTSGTALPRPLLLSASAALKSTTLPVDTFRPKLSSVAPSLLIFATMADSRASGAMWTKRLGSEGETTSSALTFLDSIGEAGPALEETITSTRRPPFLAHIITFSCRTPSVSNCDDLESNRWILLNAMESSMRPLNCRKYVPLQKLRGVMNVICPPRSSMSWAADTNAVYMLVVRRPVLSIMAVYSGDRVPILLYGGFMITCVNPLGPDPAHSVTKLPWISLPKNSIPRLAQRRPALPNASSMLRDSEPSISYAVTSTLSGAFLNSQIRSTHAVKRDPAPAPGSSIWTSLCLYDIMDAMNLEIGTLVKYCSRICFLRPVRSAGTLTSIMLCAAMIPLPPYALLLTHI